MIYAKWFLMCPLSAVMAVVGRVVAPVLPFFADDKGWLPSYLSWFQTPDNSLDGDSGHKARWPGTSPLRTYMRRVAWLLRNCCYGFDETVCGVASLPTDELIKRGNSEASDTNAISGTCHRWLFRGDKLIAFHYYRVKHYRIFRLKACVRISLGWKLWNPACLPKQFTCYVHPFKKMKWEK